MVNAPPESAGLPGPLHWFPEFLRLRPLRLRSQLRLMGSAILIGIVAGVGAIGFYMATRIIEHYALGVIVGYQPAIRPTDGTDAMWSR
jgi:hypothetical protein